MTSCHLVWGSGTGKSTAKKAEITGHFFLFFYFSTVLLEKALYTFFRNLVKYIPCGLRIKCLICYSDIFVQFRIDRGTTFTASPLATYALGQIFENLEDCRFWMNRHNTDLVKCDRFLIYEGCTLLLISIVILECSNSLNQALNIPYCLSCRDAKIFRL